MKVFQLNKNIPIPLYFQLKQRFIQDIEDGSWKPGDIVPSERTLSETYQISRMTVRQAMRELVNEGMLIRERGKGTFVAEPKISQGLLSLTSFSEDMRARGMVPGSTVLSNEILPAESKIAEYLEIQPSSSVLSLKRVRTADEKPMAIEQTHLSLQRFPLLEQFDFNQVSLYGWLEDTYGVRISHAKQMIEVAIPQPEEAEILQISRSIPIILTKRTTYDHQNQPIEYAKSSYRGDRYTLTVDLQR